MVYFALPVDMFEHPCYARVLQTVKRRFPHNVIFEPAKARWTLERWLAIWPKLLPRLSVVVVWPRADDSIGRGCCTEIEDAQSRDIPVFVYRDGEFTDRFSIKRLPGDSWRHWAFVKYLKHKPKVKQKTIASTVES